MSLSTEFERRLDALWFRRTAALRSLVNKRPGRRSDLSKPLREKAIADLQDLATEILCRGLAKREMGKLTRYRRRRHLVGRGLKARYERIVSWAEQHLDGPIIYSFWRGRRCLYVGKATTWHRLKSYRKSVYLLQASTLKVHAIQGGSQLSKAECLATHLFSPRDNAVKAARKKWSKLCPVCAVCRQIRGELRALFRMR